MHTRANENRHNRSRAVAGQTSKTESGSNPTFQFVDNRPEARQLMQLQTMMDNSPQAAIAAQLKAMADRSPAAVAQMMRFDVLSGRPVQRQKASGEEEDLQMKAAPGVLQRQGEEEEDLQMKATPGLIQRQGEEEEDLQMKVAPGLIQRQGEEEEDLQMKAGPIVLQRNDDGPPSGGTGTTLGGMFRTGINGIASFFGGFNVRDHNYATSPISLGKITKNFNSKTAFKIISQGPVDLTVPGAIKGKGGSLFGRRTEGGTAYAFMGGPVTTTSDVETMIISNMVQDGHLFGGGVYQRFWEKDGMVMTQMTGTGYGNFSRINEIMGVPLFTLMAYSQRRYIRKLFD